MIIFVINQRGKQGKGMDFVVGWNVGGLVVIKLNKSALAVPLLFHLRQGSIRSQRVPLPLHYPIRQIIVKQHFPNLLEQILDIFAGLRTDLHKGDIIFIRQSLPLSQLDHSVAL